jgi:hypothetical protein
MSINQFSQDIDNSFEKISYRNQQILAKVEKLAKEGRGWQRMANSRIGEGSAIS